MSDLSLWDQASLLPSTRNCSRKLLLPILEAHRRAIFLVAWLGSPSPLFWPARLDLLLLRLSIFLRFQHIQIA